MEPQTPAAPAESDIIRLAREAAGMTAKTAAEASRAHDGKGISVTYWRDVERGYGGRRGQRVPVRASDRALAAMARVVAVQPAQLTEAGREGAARVLEEILRRESARPAPFPRRRLKVLEDADEPGLAPYLQAVRREVYAAADVLAMFPPGDLPGPETIPEIAPLLDVLLGEQAFPESATEPTVWDMRDRLTVAERIRLIARLRRMTAEAGQARDRRASG